MISEVSRQFEIQTFGSKYIISLDENLTVEDLKIAIWKETSAHPIQQRLFSAGKPLQNEAVLKDVPQKINLVWRLKPAPVSDFIEEGKTIFRTYTTEVPQPEGPSKFMTRIVFPRMQS